MAGTKIIIEFNEDLPLEKLNELMGEIHAICGEDSDGSSWTEDGECNVSVNMDD